MVCLVASYGLQTLPLETSGRTTLSNNNSPVGWGDPIRAALFVCKPTFSTCARAACQAKKYTEQSRLERMLQTSLTPENHCESQLEFATGGGWIPNFMGVIRLAVFV